MTLASQVVSSLPAGKSSMTAATGKQSRMVKGRSYPRTITFKGPKKNLKRGARTKL